MTIQSARFIPFMGSAAGSPVVKAISVFPEGFATEKAMATLNEHPEILITTFNNNFDAYNQGFEKVTKSAVRVTSGGTEVISFRKDRSANVWRTDDSKVFFHTPSDGMIREPEESIESPAYPHARQVIDITHHIMGAELELPMSCVGEREFEENRPIFASSSSFAFKVYEWMFKLSLMFNLEGMNGLDLGSGTGIVALIGSHFFRSFSGIENQGTLHLCALGSEKVLREGGSLGNRTRLMLGSGLSDEFDMSPYDFVYICKPIYDNMQKFVDKLRGLRSGALVLSRITPEMSFDDEFEHLMSLAPYERFADPHLFRRK